MPIVKRKPVQPQGVPAALLSAYTERKEDRAVFFLAATGEVFEEYEPYAARLSYYHQRIFQCELSGKSNLTFFEAAESEAQHTRAIQSQFPDALKVPVLRAAQFQTCGRLTELVERVYECMRQRFFVGEEVSVEDGARKLGIVRGGSCPAHPDRPLHADLQAGDEPRDDAPHTYTYTIELPASHTRLENVRAEQLSRGRLAFTKTILRRFLRDALCRDAAGLMWLVREPTARRFGLPTEVPAPIQQKIDEAQAAKRRKSSDDAPHAKRRDTKKEEAPKPTPKYPCEDTLLDPITPDELQVQVTGELPRQAHRPRLDSDEHLNVPPELFESFLAVYYFFLSLGEPLGISHMALDDLDGALRHPVSDPPCPLLAEVHAVLLNAIVRDGAHSRDLAPAAVAQRRALQDVEMPEEETSDEQQDAASDVSELSDSPERHVLDAARELSDGWSRRQLSDEHRRGWERSVMGCLVDRATPDAVPRYLGILSHLTGVEYDDDASTSNAHHTVSERYVHLPLSDKIHILLFLCELAVLTRDVKAYYDECESHLTELRKERVELARLRKKTREQMQTLHAPAGKEEEQEQEEEQEDAAPEEPASDSDSERDELASDDVMDEADEADRYKRLAGTRQEALREKALQREEEEKRLAEEQARSKEQVRETKQLRDERRRLAESLQWCLRREEAIEREFRQYAQIPRLQPLGCDRFLDRYYWLDGIGSAAASAYQTGRLFVQAPHRREWDALCTDYAGGSAALERRRRTELQLDEPCAWGAWGVYTQPEQMEQLIAWLRPRGIREQALKAQLLKYRDAIEGGMRRRIDDIALGVREPVVETRRSTRMRSEQATQLRMPYMQWRNTART